VIAADSDFARMRDYVVGRLSDDERRAFEDRLVREPELVRELERSLALREGLQRLRAQRYFARATYHGRGARVWLPTLAAASIAGVALFLWGQRQMTAPPVLLASLESRSGAEVPPHITRFTFVSMRGGPTFDLALPSAGLIEILAPPSTRLAHSRYRVTLIRSDHADPGKTIGVLAAVALSADGYVHCFADASRLSAGSYVLSVEPDTATPGVAESFAFNLRASGTQPSR
jgi:hypothetical protein